MGRASYRQRAAEPNFSIRARVRASRTTL